MNQKIDDIGFCEPHSFVLQWQLHMTAMSDSSEFQLAGQAALITRFQQAGTQVAMYLNGGPDGSSTNRVNGMLN
jgi:hypothetical protein